MFVRELIKWGIKEFYQPFIFRKCKIYSYVPPKCIMGKYICIGKNVYVRETQIGAYTFINDDVQIDIYTQSIGRYCSIAKGVRIGLGPHPLNYISTSPALYSKSRGIVSKDYYFEKGEIGETVIEDDVWIGANAIVLGGVRVGRGAVIGAGTVVTKDVQPFAIVVGNPAKTIRYRFDEKTINEIQRSKWWEKDAEKFICGFKEWETILKSPEEFIKENNCDT